MGNFATASRRESDPFPPTRSRGVQRDSLGPRSQNRPRLGLDQVARNSNLRLGEPPLRGDRHNPARKWENNNNNHIRAIVIVLSLLLLVRKIYFKKKTLELNEWWRLGRPSLPYHDAHWQM